jgi:hypothetical protein
MGTGIDFGLMLTAGAGFMLAFGAAGCLLDGLGKIICDFLSIAIECELDEVPG